MRQPPLKRELLVRLERLSRCKEVSTAKLLNQLVERALCHEEAMVVEVYRQVATLLEALLVKAMLKGEWDGRREEGAAAKPESSHASSSSALSQERDHHRQKPLAQRRHARCWRR